MLRPVAPPSACRPLLRLTYEWITLILAHIKLAKWRQSLKEVLAVHFYHTYEHAHTHAGRSSAATLLYYFHQNHNPPFKKKLCRSELNTINKMSSACTHKAEDGLKLAEFIDTQSSSCNIIMNGSFFSAEWISSKTVSATWLDLSNGWLWEWVILCYNYYWHKSGAAGWHAVVLL